MSVRVATCSCRQLSVRCRGEPEKVSLCHCLACQRRTGSAFGVAAFFDREAVVFMGEANAYRRDSESGHAVTFHFCPQCGATVYWEPERMAAWVAVALGAFADPSFPAPQQAVFEQHRHPWLDVRAAHHEGKQP